MIQLKNIHPLSDFLRNTKTRIKQLKKTGEPVILTVNGKAEAVVLSAAGGLIGIALGIGGAVMVASTMGWPFVVSPLWISVAFGISMAIGVVFGFYPARKAARMNPIDALRFE